MTWERTAGKIQAVTDPAATSDRNTTKTRFILVYLTNRLNLKKLYTLSPDSTILTLVPI